MNWNWMRQDAPEGPAQHCAVPASVSANLIPIGEELSRLEEGARYSSQVQFEAAKSWQRWNLFLGVPASIFGLFTGGAAFTEAFAPWVVGTGALIGAGLAGSMTVLGAERRGTRAKTCANTFHDIQDDARRMLLINLTDMEQEEARTALASLSERYSETRQTADAPARRFYKRAKNNLAEGGQLFAVDVARTTPSPAATDAQEPPQNTEPPVDPAAPTVAEQED